MLNIYELEQLIESEMTAAQVPALALAVIHERKIVYARGFGRTATGESGTSVTAETLFRVGSLTKPMTALLILRLVEEGLLELDTPVVEYMPWFRLSDAEATRTLTLRHLLSHSSGLGNQADHYGRRDPEGLRAYVRDVIPTRAVHFSPGKLHAYSNNNFNIAGAVAEEVTGRAYAELMQEYVFDALGMTATTFDPLQAMSGSLALPHLKNADSSLRVLKRFPDNVANYPSFFAMSNVLDLAQMALFHMNGGQAGDTQVLPASRVEEMQRVHIPLGALNPFGTGLGIFSLVRRGVTLLSHFGDIASYSGNMVVAPEHGTAVVILNNNRFPIDKVIYKVLDQLIPREMPAPPAATEPSAEERAGWANLAGSYFGPLCGLVTLKADGEQMLLDHNGTEFPLVRLRSDIYLAVDQEGNYVKTIGLVPEAEGPMQYVLVDNNFAQRFEPTSEPYVPCEEQLTNCAGSYSQDEIVPCEILVNDGRLRLKDDWGEVDLIPFREHLYISPTFGTYHFVFENGAEQASKLIWSQVMDMTRVD